MRYDQIQYNGEDLNQPQSAILGLPIMQDETVKTVIVRVREAVTANAVFNLQKNGVDLFGNELTIPSGQRRVKLTDLNISLNDDDDVTLDFKSGNVTSPVTLGLGFDEETQTSNFITENGEILTENGENLTI